MIQDVIIARVHIKRQGERNYFQINLPHEAQKIVGVELGAFFNSALSQKSERRSLSKAFKIKRNKLLGLVQLQCPGRPNHFYAGELIQEDANIGITDFFSLAEKSQYNSRIWKSRQFTHGGVMALDEILTGNDKVIYGCYKDVIGKTEARDLSYIAMVYVWFQHNEKNKRHDN